MKRAATESVTARAIAPAKINPWLEVLGKRPDGYHEIQTWMVAVDLCDTIEACANATGKIALAIEGPCATPDIPADATNLAWRAAASALELARGARTTRGGRSNGAELGVALKLVKNIPSQAGLGGASSDAAATWLAVMTACGIETDESLAASALAKLGSDCVFFAKAASTGVGWCEGRGERVTIGARVGAPWFVALLTPSVLCPTAAVYAAFRKTLSDTHQLHRLPPHWSDMSANAIRRLFFNELEDVALSAIPALAPWRKLLDACQGEHFRLSGSGSSFYGLFEKRDEAERTLDRIVGEGSARGLYARGHWVVQPTGFGAKLEVVRADVAGS